MKLLKYTILCLLLLASPVYAGGPMSMIVAGGGSGAAAAKCAGANNYVGTQTESGGSAVEYNGLYVRQGSTQWSIGGTGTVDICAIQAFVQKSDTSTGNNFRMAVYDSDSNLVCQGSAQLDVVQQQPTFAWEGHVYASSGLTGTCTLDRTATYRIGWASDSVKAKIYRVTGGASGVMYYWTGDKTGGWDASLTGGTAYTEILSVRVGWQ